MANLRDSLQSIYDERGKLTPPLVVAEWRDPNHPDHHRLEWDDSVASERYREIQAQKLIQSVTITYRKAEKKQPERSVRYWQSVRGEQGHVYKPTEEVVQNEVESQIVLKDMEREWKNLKARYGHFAEFREMVRRDLEPQSSDAA